MLKKRCAFPKIGIGVGPGIFKASLYVRLFVCHKWMAYNSKTIVAIGITNGVSRSLLSAIAAVDMSTTYYFTFALS